MEVLISEKTIHAMAIRQFKIALEINPDDPVVRGNLDRAVSGKGGKGGNGD